MSGYVTFERLAEIFERYKDMVYFIALNQTKNVADAEDVLQKVFEYLVRRADRLNIRDEEHLKATLITATRNTCNSHFRSAWVRRTQSYDDRLATPAGKEDDYSGSVTESDPDESFLSDPIGDPSDDEQRMQVFLAISKLPSLYGEPTLLHYYEGLPIREVARQLKAKEGTIKKRLSTARDMIKKLLERM